jgi:hypothetical protein
VKWLPMMVSACLIIVACFVAYPFFMTGGDYLPRDGENNSNPNGGLNENPAPGENGEPLDPLMSYDEQALKEAYIEFITAFWAEKLEDAENGDLSTLTRTRQWSCGGGSFESIAFELDRAKTLTADEISMVYFGLYNGFEVVYMYVTDRFVDDAVGVMEVAGYKFSFGSCCQMHLLVYTGETFLLLSEAYEQGLLSRDDIDAIHDAWKTPVERLIEAYVSFLNIRTGVAHPVYSADDVYVLPYGTYGNYEVAMLTIISQMQAVDMEYPDDLIIAGLNFGRGRFSRSIAVRTGEADFISLSDAYEQGLLSRDDIAAIRISFFGYSVYNPEEEFKYDPSLNSAEYYLDTRGTTFAGPLGSVINVTYNPHAGINGEMTEQEAKALAAKAIDIIIAMDKNYDEAMKQYSMVVGSYASPCPIKAFFEGDRNLTAVLEVQILGIVNHDENKDPRFNQLIVYTRAEFDDARNTVREIELTFADNGAGKYGFTGINYARSVDY